MSLKYLSISHVSSANLRINLKVFTFPEPQYFKVYILYIIFVNRDVPFFIFLSEMLALWVNRCAMSYWNILIYAHMEFEPHFSPYYASNVTILEFYGCVCIFSHEFRSISCSHRIWLCGMLWIYVLLSRVLCEKVWVYDVMSVHIWILTEQIKLFLFLCKDDLSKNFCVLEF